MAWALNGPGTTVGSDVAEKKGTVDMPARALSNKAGNMNGTAVVVDDRILLHPRLV
jgi:hypothetical protein